MHYACWLIEGGEVTIEWAGGSRRVGPGNWVQPAPDTVRDQNFSPGAQIVSLRFGAEWSGGRILFSHPEPLIWPAEQFPRLAEEALRLQDRVSSVTTNRIGRLANVRISLPDYGHIRHAFAGWFTEWVRILHALGHEPKLPGDIDPRVCAAQGILNKRYYLASVPYGEILRECGVSRVHLDRLFVSDLGRTPKQYADRRCLAEAMKLLHDTHLTVKEVTYRLGFPAPSHFCRWFRRHTGVYPRRYRQNVSEP